MVDKSNMQHCGECDECAGFYCNGCSQMFCQAHADEHRQELYEQFDWLTVDHDDLIRTLDSNVSVKHKSQPSRIVIDQWEEESIKYIRKTAIDARHALLDAIQVHVNEMKEKLKPLTNRLNQVSKTCDNNENIFDERNLKQWATELRQLKEEFLSSQTFTVRIHGNKPVVMPIIKIQPTSIFKSLPLDQSFGLTPIRKPFFSRQSSTSSIHRKQEKSISDDRFHLSTEHAKILDEGQLIIHDLTKNEASIRGAKEYSQGEHSLFFRIEQITANQKIFFGITSAHASTLHHQSYLDSSTYGWDGYNCVYVNGKSMPTLNGYVSDMRVNDFVELTIDCDKQKLFLWHTRQTHRNKLPVDLRSCPFPWQFLIGCQNEKDSVRLIPTSMGQMIKRKQENVYRGKENGFKDENHVLPMQSKINTNGIV